MTKNEICWCQLIDVPVLMWVFLVAKRKNVWHPYKIIIRKGSEGQQMKLLINVISKCYFQDAAKRCCQCVIKAVGGLLLRHFALNIVDLFSPLLTLLSLQSYFFCFSFTLCLTPFLERSEGWDDYHFRKVKGQQGFSSGRLISWPWHSLFHSLFSRAKLTRFAGF